MTPSLSPPPPKLPVMVELFLLSSKRFSAYQATTYILCYDQIQSKKVHHGAITCLALANKMIYNHHFNTHKTYNDETCNLLTY